MDLWYWWNMVEFSTLQFKRTRLPKKYLLVVYSVYSTHQWLHHSQYTFKAKTRYSLSCGCNTAPHQVTSKFAQVTRSSLVCLAISCKARRTGGRTSGPLKLMMLMHPELVTKCNKQHIIASHRMNHGYSISQAKGAIQHPPNQGLVAFPATEMW